MAANTNGGYRTPIPNREVENRTRVNSEVTVRKMTDEERAKYFPAAATVPRDSLGERINPPVAQKPNFAPDEHRRREQAKARYQKEEKDMSGQEASQQDERFVPSKIEFLKGIAAGKSISKLERLWNMNPGALHYWVSKWNLKGIKPDRAEQMLDEIAAEQAREPAKPRGLAAINEQFGQPPAESADSEDPFASAAAVNKVIDDLKNQLQKALEQLRAITEERDNWEKEYATLEQSWTELREDRDAWRGRVEELKQAVVELEAERLLLLETIELDASQSDGIEVTTTVDNVNAPAHYTAGGIETIDFIRAKLTPEEFVGYCKGNALKYVSRANHKGGDEDLRKANKYLGWAVTG